jgi:hypothetical protein
VYLTSNTISPPRLSLNYQNQTRTFHLFLHVRLTQGSALHVVVVLRTQARCGPDRGLHGFGHSARRQRATWRIQEAARGNQTMEVGMKGWARPSLDLFSFSEYLLDPSIP